MKIEKGLLKQNEKDNLGTQELYSEDTYWNIAQLYENAIKKYAKKNIWFLPPQTLEPKRQQKYKQIRKFIDLCIEFEISFEVVMDEQVRVLMNFINEKNLPQKYPYFNMLISEGAKKRMEYIKKGIAKRYTGRARIEESHKVLSLNIEKSLRESMGKVYNQFKRTKDFIGAIGEFEATQELEVMARAKFISNIYIYSSPLGEKTEFLKRIKEDAGKRLSDQQKEAIVKIKKALISEFKDKEILKYV